MEEVIEWFNYSYVSAHPRFEVNWQVYRIKLYFLAKTRLAG